MPGNEAARQAEVIVVGAGLAGLAAARALVTAGVEPLVVEARDRVGGRTFTVTTPEGVALDLGAHWVGPTQRRMLALGQALGVATANTWDTGLNIQSMGGKRETYSGAIPTADPLVAADAVQAILNLNMLAMQVPVEAPWQSPNAADWDAQTCATWIEGNVAPGARPLLELAIQAVFSAEPRDLSLLHVLFYVHSAGGLRDLLGVTGAAQERRFVGGSQQIANRLASDLDQRIILGAPVNRIAWSESGVLVTSDAGDYAARRAIIAIPPTLAGRIRYAPALPGFRDQLTQRMPMGSVIKVLCVYPSAFWRRDGLTGQVSSDSGAIRITFDISPDGDAPGLLVGFIEGDEGRRWGRATAEERRVAALACLVDYFGPAAAAPTHYVEQSWAEEEWSRGCYAGCMPPGVWTTFGEALRAPIGPLHWAGTETATEWMGYMEGAVQSGERAAAETLAALGH
ncbi:MAG TPA: FAD-dependent oxidoreductase [Ktedonobacterales bacterium]